LLRSDWLHRLGLLAALLGFLPNAIKWP
jgi:hypothetical protein